MPGLGARHMLVLTSYHPSDGCCVAQKPHLMAVYKKKEGRVCEMQTRPSLFFFGFLRDFGIGRGIVEVDNFPTGQYDKSDVIFNIAVL